MKKINIGLYTKNNQKNFSKIDKINSIIKYVLTGVCLLGVVMCIVGFIFNDRFSLNLLWDVGISITLTTILTLLFMWVEKLATQNKVLKEHSIFYEKIFFLFYAIIWNIGCFANVEGHYNCVDFLQECHRYYHNHYKKIIANSKEFKDTKDRIELINSFCEIYDGDFKQLEKLYFSNYVLNEIDSHLDTLFLAYTNLSNVNKSNTHRIFSMGELLNTIRILIERQENLSELKLIEVDIKENDIHVDTRNLKQIEPLIKFIEEFNEIRLKNYKNEYGIHNEERK